MHAQSNVEEIEFYQSIFGMEKKAAVASFIKLEGDANDTFWALYDEYETARKAHGKKRLDLLANYAQNYLTLDDIKTEELMSKSIAINNEYNKLLLKYYNKIKKEVGIKPAAQFHQLERYFQFLISASIYEQFPLIGEIE
jgi:hypothetical protein